MSTELAKHYPPAEERLNIGSHAIGLALSVTGLVLLLISAIGSAESVRLVAYLVYGLSMVILYTASTVYHATKKPRARSRMRVLDHAAIYVLIAGTYTPFMLLTMPTTLGYGILIAAWSMAVLGIVLKVFFTGRFVLVSTLLYVFMGWAIVFAIKPLAAAMSTAGLWWLISGGIAYTVGALLYAIKQLPFNHALFHVFVVLGSWCHFMAVYHHT